MRQMQHVCVFILLFLTLGCDPIGKELGVGPNVSEDNELVYSFENLKLEKGDILTIWGQFSASYVKNNIIPVYKLKYNLSVNDSTVANDVVRMFDNKDYIINSIYSMRDTEDDSDSFESNWSFEQKTLEIPITQDGNYAFDYKVDRSEDHLSFSQLSIVIRKR